MRGSLYLSVFGDAESRTIPFTSHPVNAQDGLQCYSGFDSTVRDRDSFNHYSCRAFFGWPSRLVYAKTGDRKSEFTRLLSYSPFPSGLDLDSTESRYTSLVLNDGTSREGLHEVTIVTEKPLVHLRRDLEAPHVSMYDFLVTQSGNRGVCHAACRGSSCESGSDRTKRSARAAARTLHHETPGPSPASRHAIRTCTGTLPIEKMRGACLF